MAERETPDPTIDGGLAGAEEAAAREAASRDRRRRNRWRRPEGPHVQPRDEDRRRHAAKPTAKAAREGEGVNRRQGRSERRPRPRRRGVGNRFGDPPGRGATQRLGRDDQPGAGRHPGGQRDERRRPPGRHRSARATDIAVSQGGVALARGRPRLRRARRDRRGIRRARSGSPRAPPARSWPARSISSSRSCGR